MAMLLFKGETLTVRVTHNVISELIRLNGTTFVGAIQLSTTDPMGWSRDVLYCFLRVYKPEVLGVMTKYEVGDELFNLSIGDRNDFLKGLLEDFVAIAKSDNPEKKVASEKK